MYHSLFHAAKIQHKTELTKFSGYTAKTYDRHQLKLDKCADIIPVSRSFVPQFKTYLT